MFELEKPSPYLQRKSQSPYDEGFDDGRESGYAEGARAGVEAFRAKLEEQVGLKADPELCKTLVEVALAKISTL